MSIRHTLIRFFLSTLIIFTLTPSFAGTLRGGLVLQNSTKQNFKLISYKGDAAFTQFVQKDLKSHLKNGTYLSPYMAFRTGLIEDLWQGVVLFKSSHATVTIHYNGSYAPDHGRGLSCTSTGVDCMEAGGWDQQQADIQIFQSHS